MDDPDRVCRGETAEKEVHLRRDLGHRTRPGARDEVGDRSSFRELHRVPRHVATAVPIEDRHDGRVRELRGELRLAPEAPTLARRARCVDATA